MKMSSTTQIFRGSRYSIDFYGIIDSTEQDHLSKIHTVHLFDPVDILGCKCDTVVIREGTPGASYETPEDQGYWNGYQIPNHR